MNITGIIFANDASLTELTEKRTMASLPYGGRYRHVDFHLSNMAAAGIRKVGILSRRNYQSLMNHVGSGEEWGLEMEEGGMEFLTPFAMSTTYSYRGKLESLYAAMSFLESGEKGGYVVMADSAVLSNLDLTKVIASHVESGRDLTVVTKAGIANGQKQLDLAFKLNDKGEICDIAVDYVASEEYLASMDVFVLSKDLLMNAVREFIPRNLFHMDRDFVLGQWQKGTLSVNLYQFDGVALFNDSVEEYFRNSLALTDSQVRHDLFGRNHPVFTKVRDRVPCYYAEGCRVDNCIVADGCVFDGEVSNTVIFRNVTICQSAKVSDCIIMNDTVVGEGSDLRYAILDKDVVVRPGARLHGTPTNPVIIKRGDIV